MRPDWFPDWSDAICAIVGGGESVARCDVDALRGRAKVIVINRSHELAPWADALYAADRRFWDVYAGVRDFAGLRITPDLDAAQHFRLRRVDLAEMGSPLENSLSLEPGVLARGGHGGHQSLNLAVQFGARRVALLGYDLTGEHWHGRHEAPLRNPRETRLEEWRRTLDALAPLLSTLNVEVVNCSRLSKLTAYPRMSIGEALARWSEISTSRQSSCDGRARDMRLETTNSALPPA